MNGNAEEELSTEPECHLFLLISELLKIKDRPGRHYLTKVLGVFKVHVDENDEIHYYLEEYIASKMWKPKKLKLKFLQFVSNSNVITNSSKCSKVSELSKNKIMFPMHDQPEKKDNYASRNCLLPQDGSYVSILGAIHFNLAEPYIHITSCLEVGNIEKCIEHELTIRNHLINSSESFKKYYQRMIDQVDEKKRRDQILEDIKGFSVFSMYKK